jgi:hypothetical protein
MCIIINDETAGIVFMVATHRCATSHTAALFKLEKRSVSAAVQ